MKKWQEILNRRDFLRISAESGLVLLLGGCAARPTRKPIEKSTEGASISAQEFLSSFGPIDRTLGEQVSAEFSGDRFQRAHRILWNLPEYLTSRKPDGPDEEAPIVIVGGGISGLFTAYGLRQHRPIVLEQAPRFGGNSKGQSWRGLDYSIGAAYIDLPEEGTPVYELYQELGLDRILVKRETHDPIVFDGKFYANFWAGDAEPRDRVEYERLAQYLTRISSEKERPFPRIPSIEPDQLESIRHFDRDNLYTHLARAVGGRFPRAMEAALEYYCWSSFGASSREISAAAGINFLRGEGAVVCAGAGGNARIAELLLQRSLDEVPASCFRTNSLVVQVQLEPEGNRVLVLYEDGDGRLRRIRARSVVMACPKFVAARILSGLDAERGSAISRVRYRSYMVANLLLRTPIRKKIFDVYLIDRDRLELANLKAAQAERNATDFIVANYAAPSSDVGVITLYRAFPYDGARAELLGNAESSLYSRYRKSFEQQIESSILPLLGLRSTDVADLRLTLWGHAIPVAAQGIYSDDTVSLLRRPFRERVFFIEQDNWALPAMETGATESVLQRQLIRRVL